MTLEQTASKTAGCSVSSIGWLAVKETFGADTVWDGPVEIFQYSGAPPRFVFGWTVEENGKGSEHVTVLRSAEINSPSDAIHAWYVSQANV